MTLLPLICAVLISIITSFCHAKDIAPGISEYLYCDGCISTIKELKKMTDKKSLESRDVIVSEALENICKPYNFVAYEYSPPKTVKACKLLLEKHEEEIEAVLVKKFKDDVVNEICYKISKACVNVDRSKKPKDASDIDLTTDGKTKKVQKEISIDTHSGTSVVGEENKEKSKNEARTLSKKDKKAKKTKPKKEGKIEKHQNPKGGAADIFQVDINDPDSINKVLSQIKQVTEDHKEDFYEKEEKERRNAKDEF